MQNISIAQFSARELDAELARRQRVPLTLLSGDAEQWMSLADLRAEFAAMAATHPDYRWRAWELALAERQHVHRPDSRFYRIVTPADIADRTAATQPAD